MEIFGNLSKPASSYPAGSSLSFYRQKRCDFSRISWCSVGDIVGAVHYYILERKGRVKIYQVPGPGPSTGGRRLFFETN